MTADKTLEMIGEAEGLALAATAPVGRVVYSRYALPAVHVVNFKLDGRDVVFRARKGAKFAVAVAGSVVAFEVDHIDEETRSGWTVTVLGRAELVTSPREQERLESLGVDPWEPTDRDYFVRIRTERVSGRRVGDATRSPAGAGR